MSGPYDLVFAGDLELGEIHPFGGGVYQDPRDLGGVPFFSALAAVCTGKKIAVVLKLADRDRSYLDVLREKGVDVYTSPSPESTSYRVDFLSANVDERVISRMAWCGAYSVDDLAEIEPTILDLCGSDSDLFTLDFVHDISRKGFRLALDMQAFVRMVDPETGVVALRDIGHKQELAGIADKLKLDVAEAECLTGTSDIEQAAIQFEGWGARETMVTRSDGVLVRHSGKSYFEPFTNRSVEGRTGRGDSTFSSYLAWRLDHDVPESLKFAATLASIKMETRGSFAGTLDQVLERMRSEHRWFRPRGVK